MSSDLSTRVQPVCSVAQQGTCSQTTERRWELEQWQHKRHCSEKISSRQHHVISSHENIGNFWSKQINWAQGWACSAQMALSAFVWLENSALSKRHQVVRWIRCELCTLLWWLLRMRTAFIQPLSFASSRGQLRYLVCLQICHSWTVCGTQVQLFFFFLSLSHDQCILCYLMRAI